MPQDSRETVKEYLMRMHQDLKTCRSSFDAHWREVAEFVQPRAGRFSIDDVNKGDKRYRNIINSAATRAHRKARAGLLAGLMSPARPWFALETVDTDLMESAAVKQWCYQVERLLRAVFNQSNLYNQAPVLLGDTLLFGTSALAHINDYNDVARFEAWPVGSFCLAQDSKGRIDTAVREYTMTVRQMVTEFGLDAVSLNVRNAWDKSNYEARFPIVRFIEPNPGANAKSPWSIHKPWRQVWFEYSGDNQKLLRQEGFDEFPVHAPRWDVTGEDVYATDCPGMTALGDVKGLQMMERRLAQGIDKLVNPPLVGPASLKTVNVQSLPGGLTVYDGDPNRTKLGPLYTVQPQVDHLRLNIQGIEKRIDEDFFVDLFMSVSTMEGIQPQNQLYLMQREAEKLLQLGPTLERMHGEFLTPLVDRTFNQLMRAGALPEAPPELGGQPLRVRYVSSLAMAQRSVATTNIDRMVAFVGGLMQVGYTQVVDKFDADQAVDEYAQALGVPPRLIVEDQQVQALRQQRAQMQQAQMAAQMAQAGANTAKMLSDAKTSDPSVLTAMAGGTQQ